jgi:hypothetical protein
MVGLYTILKIFKSVIVSAFKIWLTLVLLAPTAMSYWEDRPFREPITYWTMWDDTQYSLGYSEKKFKSIRIGDTAKHLISVLGKPLKKRLISPCEDKQNIKQLYWIYAQAGNRSNYYAMKQFRIDVRKGKVDLILDSWVD